MPWAEWIPEFRAGNVLALSRLISLVENRGLEKNQIMKNIFQWTGNAYVIGLTGPPGSGKSTLINCLTEHLVKRGMTVGIVCIDPSSPFSGGAFLGDRIRMSSINTRPEVFVRSVATRGSLGGLSGATEDIVQLLDAAGKDVIMVETVGLGQVGYDVKKIADTTLLVTVPGLGDSIQALKAGIMEIANVFVVNKAEREGVDDTVRDLELMLGEQKQEVWMPRVVKTSAARNEGISELWDVLETRRGLLISTGLWDTLRRHRCVNVLADNIKENILEKLEHKLANNQFLVSIQQWVEEGSLDPYTASIYIAEYFLSHSS